MMADALGAYKTSHSFLEDSHHREMNRVHALWRQSQIEQQQLESNHLAERAWWTRQFEELKAQLQETRVRCANLKSENARMHEVVHQLKMELVASHPPRSRAPGLEVPSPHLSSISAVPSCGPPHHPPLATEDRDFLQKLNDISLGQTSTVPLNRPPPHTACACVHCSTLPLPPKRPADGLAKQRGWKSFLKEASHFQCRRGGGSQRRAARVCEAAKTEGVERLKQLMDKFDGNVSRLLKGNSASRFVTSVAQAWRDDLKNAVKQVKGKCKRRIREVKRKQAQREPYSQVRQRAEIERLRALLNSSRVEKLAACGEHTALIKTALAAIEQLTAELVHSKRRAQ